MICAPHCPRPAYGNTGYCRHHYDAMRRRGTTEPRPLERNQPCRIEGCGRPREARGWCRNHYQQAYRTGKPVPPLRAEGTISADGYRVISRAGHPNGSGAQGRIAEHRFVMAEVLGRPLLPGENVHHRNGRKTDNQPENLELWVTSQPSGQRVTDVVAHARYIISTYGHLCP